MRSRSPGTVPVETPLVDRDVELSRIREAVGRVSAAEPGILVLTGLPGTGKSRLAREALAIAAETGFRTVSGHADELGRDLAYAPFTEALGQAVRAVGADERAGLVTGLDQLALVFAGTGLSVPRSLGDPELERSRLMDGFTALLDRLARDRPVAILLDDMHAADDASARLLGHIAHTVADRPIFIVLTAQPDEAGDPRLARVLSGTDGTPWWTERMPVPQLEDAAARRLLAHVLGGPLDPALAGMIVDRCAGRPLFLESLARSVLDDGDIVRRNGIVVLAEGARPRLPDDLHGQLSLHLASLSPDEARVLDMLAVADGRCRHAVLEDAVGLRRARLESALDRLDRRRLLADDAPDGYALAHGLLREAALADMSGVARRRLNAELAAALARQDPHDPRIAGHLIRAGDLVDPATAVPALREAAFRSQGLGALEDAIRFLEGARDLARRMDDETQATELTEELGRLYLFAGQREDARHAWAEALALRRVYGDADGVARAAIRLGDLAWTDGEVEQAGEHLAEAERALAGLEPTPVHAELLSLRLDHAMRVGQPGTIGADADRLRDLARRLDAPGLAVRATLAAGDRGLAGDDLVAGEERIRAALELAREADDPMLVMAATDRLSVAACLQGDLPEFRRLSASSLETVRGLGAASLEPWPRMRLVVADVLAGEWDAALRGAAEALTVSTRYGGARGRASVLATDAWMLALRGRLAEARDRLDEATVLARPTQDARARSSSILAVAGCAIAMAGGDPEEATRLGAELADPRSGWFGTVAIMELGEALAGAGLPERARELAVRMRGIHMRTDLGGIVADWLDAVGGDLEAPALLDASTRGFERLGLVFHAARARLALAEAVAATDAERAIGLAGEAQAVFDRIGAAARSRQARAVLRSLGVVPSRGRPRPQTGAALSPRELDVARLVASGGTNAQIATALFISPRTVTTHLDHMYQRLGLGSRAALTRYLADSGLLESDADTHSNT